MTSGQLLSCTLTTCKIASHPSAATLCTFFYWLLTLMQTSLSGSSHAKQIRLISTCPLASLLSGQRPVWPLMHVACVVLPAPGAPSYHCCSHLPPALLAHSLCLSCAHHCLQDHATTLNYFETQWHDDSPTTSLDSTRSGQQYGVQLWYSPGAGHHVKVTWLSP